MVKNKACIPFSFQSPCSLKFLHIIVKKTKTKKNATLHSWLMCLKFDKYIGKNINIYDTK
jgi:hypothetical protein